MRIIHCQAFLFWWKCRRNDCTRMTLGMCALSQSPDTYHSLRVDSPVKFSLMPFLHSAAPHKHGCVFTIVYPFTKHNTFPHHSYTIHTIITQPSACLSTTDRAICQTGAFCVSDWCFFQCVCISSVWYGKPENCIGLQEH